MLGERERGREEDEKYKFIILLSLMLSGFRPEYKM